MPSVVTTANMREHISPWAAYLREERNRQPSTVARYRAAVEDFVAFCEATSRALADVGSDDLVAFLRAQQRAGSDPSPSSWNAHLAAVRSFLAHAKQRGLIPRNPAELVERQRRKRKPAPCALTFDEMLALVDAAQASSSAYRARNVAIVQTFFHTGARVSELVSLSTAQLDIERRCFTRVRVKGDHLHDLLFNDVVASALEDYLAVRDEFGLHADEPALFLSDRGTRLSVRAVQDLVVVLSERAGLTRRVHPHLFRRSNATELSALGVALPVIQDHLCHADIRTTRGYINTTHKQRRDAVDALGKSFAERAACREASPGAPA